MTTQPDFLMTDNHVPWAWGVGNDVWGMFKAAMTGDIAGLGQLLDKEPSLIRCSCHYREPMHFAVREGQLEAVRFLLGRGAEVPYATGKGTHNSAVMMAFDRGDTEVHSLLSEHLFEAFGICEAGDTVGAAIRDLSSAESSKLIIQHGVDVADARGNKALHWAVMTRQRTLIDLCLKHGADINATRPDGARPLDLTNGDYYYRGWRDTHPEGESDHWVLVEHLLARGADYDLTMAARRNDIDRVREILAEDPEAANRDALYNTWYSGFPLRSAAKAGHIEIVRLLLEHGADPNKPEHGLAPFGGSLYDSAQNGHFDVVKLLLENGGNPNQDVESSGCPLSAATDDRTRQLLREYGAIYDAFGCCYWCQPVDFATLCQRDAFVTNDSSMFALAVERCPEIVEIFLKYQPDLWERMPAKLGKTPEVTKQMVRSGMNPNRTNWLGIHPLHRGCREEQLAMWLQLGADINMVCSEHQSTPLGYAARRGDVAFAKLLLRNGADPTLAGHEWAKPVEWARRRSNPAMVELLGG